MRLLGFCSTSVALYFCKPFKSLIVSALCCSDLLLPEHRGLRRRVPRQAGLPTRRGPLPLLLRPANHRFPSLPRFTPHPRARLVPRAQGVGQPVLPKRAQHRGFQTGPECRVLRLQQQAISQRTFQKPCPTTILQAAVWICAAQAPVGAV